MSASTPTTNTGQPPTQTSGPIPTNIIAASTSTPAASLLKTLAPVIAVNSQPVQPQTIQLTTNNNTSTTAPSLTTAVSPTTTATISTTTPTTTATTSSPITAKDQIQPTTTPLQLRTQTHIITSVSSSPLTTSAINQNNMRPSVVPSILAPNINNAQNRITAVTTSPSTINMTTVVTAASTTPLQQQQPPNSNALETETSSGKSIDVKPQVPSKSQIQTITQQDVEMSIEPTPNASSPSQNTTKLPTITGTVIAPAGINLITTSEKAKLITPQTTQPAQIKAHSDNEPADEPVSYVCCLMDNGVRCERIAGNASFSRRIQKIVGTKKMNFTLDPNVRHAYICEHHKGLICVAKKSNALTRDTQSNARNNTTNNTATLAQNNNNFNSDLIARQHAPSHLQHQNLEIVAGQNRLTNNHSSALNNVSIRQSSITFPAYHPSHPNQMAPMEIMMGSNYDSGDAATSSSSGIDVDLQQLQVNTLRRYKRHFRVQTRPGLNKLQLADSLKRHFRTIPIIEKEAITYFVYIVKCFRNKLDHNFKNG